MKYGLIGKNISYSYSKIIHNLFGNNEYEIFSCEENEMNQLLMSKNFKGLNITIPYKEKVIKYLDVIDESVNIIGACNLIVNKENKLYGYNVDYYGFLGLIKKENFDLENKKVAILGSGATSKTVCACLKYLKVKQTYIISREKSDYCYKDLSSLNIDYIINTTPVGGVNNDALICNIPDNVKGVIDVVYRPLLTKFLLEAKKKEIKCCNGLYMLVYQAYLSHLHFFPKEFNQIELDNVYKNILKQNTNIYLIGMPYSGKTTIGKELAKKLNRNFIDIDEEIEKEENMSIPDIFNIKGENYFRDIESRIIEKYKFSTNSVISLGGGSILNETNMNNCLQSGVIYSIKRDLKDIVFNDSRPLTSSIEEYKLLFLKREKLYNIYSSKEYINDSSLAEIVKEMECDFNETFNS